MTPQDSSSSHTLFSVEPQISSKETKSSRYGQQILFRSDQAQYKHHLQNVPEVQVALKALQQAEGRQQIIRFTDPKTQRRFDEDQRPAKRARVVRRYARANLEPSLSVRRPLKVNVPMDAWQLILQCCDLSFLLKARMVCRAFRDILDGHVLWQKARKNSFGRHIPDRPLCLTEVQYAILLAGKGCQISPCTRKETRKVYWPFMLRMCDKCYRMKIMSHGYRNCPEAILYQVMYGALEFEVRQTIPSQLSGLLPAGRAASGRWVGPRLLDYEQKNWDIDNAGCDVVVLASDYLALKQEFSDKVQTDPDYFLFWVRLKWGRTREQMSAAMQLSAFGSNDFARPRDLEDQKIVYFCQRALRLDPPMTDEVLFKFVAFHNAIETANAASTRSWDMLKVKICVPELRAQAEQLVEWEDISNISLDDDKTYNELHVHRRAGTRGFLTPYAPEQEVIVDIARQEFGRLIDVVHDEDLFLMLLAQVRREYNALEKKPEGFNADGTRGPYELTLDDARMVEEVVHHILSERGEEAHRIRRICETLRCMGCTQFKTAKTYNLTNLMNHIRKAHSSYVAKDSHWYRMAVPIKSLLRRHEGLVAWYHIPWFKTMPALPGHRRATRDMIWNPDVETDYIQYEQRMQLPTLFDMPITYHKRPFDNDLESGFSLVVRTMMGTRLSSPYIFKIALEYAIPDRKSRQSAETSTVTIKDLRNLQNVCQQIAPTLTFNFQCKPCMQIRAELGRGQRRPKSFAFADIVDHWIKKHKVKEDECILNLMLLPSSSDLMDVIEREDSKLEAEKKACRRKQARNAGTESVDPRMAVLLQTPSIQSCFEQLFVSQSDLEEDDRLVA